MTHPVTDDLPADGQMNNTLTHPYPDRGGAAATVRPPGWRVRLMAYLRRWSLDEALAEGARPDSDPALRWRARQLTSIAERRAIARALNGAIKRADRPERWSAAAPVAHASVRAARESLDGLAHDLVRPGEVSARGVAAARVLVADGASPLWGNSEPRDLLDAVEAARIGLNL